ncbi:hypothetical protein FS837_005910 [Tulasnella sp. UAMH 9824]|nr:hypothetical protein FS837_005910 [Tulasnella sp. UAMH 9824]
MKFYPAFGAYDDEIFEEYLECTVLSGVSATASIVERESFRQKLLDEYPGIDGNDPAQRAHATCKFLHDFVLDLNPVEIPYTDTVKESGKHPNQAKSELYDNDSKVDIEVPEKMTPDLPYKHRDSMGDPF